MPSPFPGMDPYLESHWGDIHHSLITYARDQLQPVLPPGLRARVEERVFVESSVGRERTLVPDLRVLERSRRRKGNGKLRSTQPGLAFAEPLLLELDEPVTQGYIEIRYADSGMRVVTVLEILSRDNKVPGEGQDKFLQKQAELRDGRVSLVVLDLLCSGQRLLPFPLERLPAAYRTPYLVCVRRGWQPTTVAIYGLPLRQRLPIIQVPLRPRDKDVPLDLQALIDQCYHNGGYENDIDYQAEPDPRLERDDARWADALLRGKGLRRRRPGARSRNGH